MNLLFWFCWFSKSSTIDYGMPESSKLCANMLFCSWIIEIVICSGSFVEMLLYHICDLKLLLHCHNASFSYSSVNLLWSFTMCILFSLLHFSDSADSKTESLVWCIMFPILRNRKVKLPFPFQFQENMLIWSGVNRLFICWYAWSSFSVCT